MASTVLNESGKWDPDVIERQLAHGERDEVRAAYNYAKHLLARRRMMQFWADELDKMKARGRKQGSVFGSARPVASAAD